VGQHSADFLISTFNMQSRPNNASAQRAVRRTFTSRAIAKWAVLFTFVLWAAVATSQTYADVLITNARVYTVNARQPWAEGVAIRGDRVLAVGTDKDLRPHRGPSTRVIDAHQHLVLPGFMDSHIHFYEGSLTLGRVHLDDAKTPAEIQQRVKAFAQAHPQEKWIIGRGWMYPVFGPAALPDKKYLDEVVRDRPVFLVCFDGHSYWANSKALALAGITRETPDPPNGTIVRDKNGEATGVLKEDAAANLVRRFIPEPAREQKIDALKRGLAEANRMGLTRVECAGGEGESSDFAVLDLLDELRRNGELTARFYVAYYLDPAEPLDRELPQLDSARNRFHDDWISAGAAKAYLDGVVEAHTAAMLTPYGDDPSLTGSLFWDPAKYRATVAELDRRGYQVFTHAIGDRAVRVALDAYEQAQQTNGSHDARERVEHIETIRAADIPRFGKLGVIASFQPLHAYPDDDTLKVWARNAGPDRASRGWPWHSIAATGGRLAFGSDWPVVTMSPWDGLQNAVTRQTWEGTPPCGWLPEQRVTLEQAVEAYTLGAAFAAHRDKEEGSLEAGKLADLIIVSQDLFKVDPHQLRNTKVLLTMVGGKVVYRSDAWKKMESR